jgi:hypothetical protein
LSISVRGASGRPSDERPGSSPIGAGDPQRRVLGTTWSQHWSRNVCIAMVETIGDIRPNATSASGCTVPQC